jgi:hypothetical protein
LPESLPRTVTSSASEVPIALAGFGATGVGSFWISFTVGSVASSPSWTSMESPARSGADLEASTPLRRTSPGSARR